MPSPKPHADAPDIPLPAYRPFGAFRLLLAVLVVVKHFTPGLAPAWFLHAVAPLEVGSIAVLAFFALSGFVIAEAAHLIYQGRATAFLVNRLLRILPHFLITALIAFILWGALQAHGLFRHPEGLGLAPDIAFSPGNILFNLLGVFPLSERFIRFNFIMIAWTLRVEMAFYIIVALALVLAPGLTRWRGARVAFSAVLLALALLCVPLFGLAVQGKGIAMFQFLPYFSFGGALYFALHGSRLAIGLSVLSLPAIGVQFASVPPHEAVPGMAINVTGQAWLLAALLLAMTLLALRPSQHFERLDRVLGDLTYPLYMSHYNVLVVLLALPLAPSTLLFGASLLLALGVATLLHRLIDPGVDALRARIRGRDI